MTHINVILSHSESFDSRAQRHSESFIVGPNVILRPSKTRFVILSPLMMRYVILSPLMMRYVILSPSKTDEESPTLGSFGGCGRLRMTRKVD